MNRTLILSFRFAACLVVTLLLAACGAAPGLGISDIAHEPEVPSKGKEVAFTIAYRNSSPSVNYSDVILDITYDPYLTYHGAEPQPETENTDQRKITWFLGSLDPNEEGKVIAYFSLLEDIPFDKYSLPVEANISGKDSQGSESSGSRSGETNILENPTPTPSVMVYEAEGVELEIPWQGYNVMVVQQDFYTDYPATPTPSPTETPAYEIIRQVIYLQVYRLDELSEKHLLEEFSPPLRVTVQYTADDVKAAGDDPNNLALFILDHHTGIWRPYTTTIDASSNTGTISVSNWTSHLSWGRPR
jgi:hypothetical protein